MDPITGDIKPSSIITSNSSIDELKAAITHTNETRINRLYAFHILYGRRVKGYDKKSFRKFRQELYAKPVKASVSVSWGYEGHSLDITARNWKRLLNGNEYSKSIRYWYEGESCSSYWYFSGGVNSELIIGGDDGAQRYLGNLMDADIVEYI